MTGGATIGKYVNGHSFVHRLDPRIKLFINILVIILIFMTNNFSMLAIIGFPFLVAFLLSPLKKIQLFKMFLPVLFIGLFIFIINLITIDAKDYKDEIDHGTFNHLWDVKTVWIFNLSDLALMRTLTIMFRIYIMIIGTTLLTTTTKPVALTRAIEDILSPLKIIKFPVHIIAMIISIAFRFIPTLISESQRIMKAQSSRGVDFKNGNMKSKAKSLITLIIPLFVSSFSKADDLGNAMETRGYNPYAKRSRYRRYPIKWSDIMVFSLFLGILAFLVVWKVEIFTLPTWFGWT